MPWGRRQGVGSVNQVNPWVNQRAGEAGLTPQDPCKPSLRDLINDPAGHLFHFMVLDETHALIFGSIGTGKTTLIKNALANVPCGYTVVVFDVAGTYEGFTDYHAP
ncbi:type IV secretion system DNA-binding domain-containing protein, partial [Vulcanisaeta distributa]|uniref:type IV secretion system DNA-binding domain-containing protein n=1 Tax=Vulcanisaeta distributa TaxID=164451 RepID=UPI000AE73FB7